MFLEKAKKNVEKPVFNFNNSKLSNIDIDHYEKSFYMNQLFLSISCTIVVKQILYLFYKFFYRVACFLIVYAFFECLQIFIAIYDLILFVTNPRLTT